MQLRLRLFGYSNLGRHHWLDCGVHSVKNRVWQLPDPPLHKKMKVWLPGIWKLWFQSFFGNPPMPTTLTRTMSNHRLIFGCSGLQHWFSSSTLASNSFPQPFLETSQSLKEHCLFLCKCCYQLYFYQLSLFEEITTCFTLPSTFSFRLCDANTSLKLRAFFSEFQQGQALSKLS